MPKKITKWNKFIVSVALTTTIPFVSSKCNSDTKNILLQPNQIEEQKIENAKAELKKSTLTLEQNKTKYSSIIYDALLSKANQALADVNALLYNPQATYEQLFDKKEVVDKLINELEKQFNALKTEKESAVKMYNDFKNEINIFIDLIKNKDINKAFNFDDEINKIKELVQKCDHLLKENNVLTSVIKNISSEISAIIEKISLKLQDKYSKLKIEVEGKFDSLTGNVYSNLKKEINDIFKSESQNNSISSFYEKVYYSLNKKYEELLDLEKRENNKTYEIHKQELSSLVASAKQLKKSISTNYSSITIADLEKYITEAESKINNNSTKEELIEIKNKLQAEVTTIELEVIKIKFSREIENAERIINEIESEKFYISLRNNLQKQIDTSKELSNKTNKNKKEYEDKLDKFISFVEDVLKNKKNISDAVELVKTDIKKVEDTINNNKDKKLFSEKIQPRVNVLNTKKHEYEKEPFDKMEVSVVLEKLNDYHDEFENLNLYIEADINQIKNEFDEYLDEWKNLYEKVEKFEKQISNNANKNKYLNTFTKSEEYTKFKDKTNIEGYNILKDELINITSKVRNSFYTTKKEFSKDEIKRLLEEFVEVGKKYNNDETYRQISFRVQGQGNKSYEELKALMNTYDDDLQYVEALLTEVENKLDGYKKKLQTT